MLLAFGLVIHYNYKVQPRRPGGARPGPGAPEGDAELRPPRGTRFGSGEGRDSGVELPGGKAPGGPALTPPGSGAV